MGEDPDTGAIEHFIRCARCGASPGASQSEKVANQFAQTLARVGDDVAILDDTAVYGLCALIKLMAGPWATCEAKDAIFALVVKAAGQKRSRR